MTICLKRTFCEESDSVVVVISTKKASHLMSWQHHYNLGQFVNVSITAVLLKSCRSQFGLLSSNSWRKSVAPVHDVQNNSVGISNLSFRYVTLFCCINPDLSIGLG